MAFAFTGVGSPAEVYVRDGDAPARQATVLNADLLAERQASITEAFDFESFDGMPVEGFLVPPVGLDPSRRYPVILRIHGGPHSQQGYGFAHRNQVYTGAGYAVVMINYRGSSGYGQKFADGTVGDQNGAEAKDVLAGAMLNYAREEAEQGPVAAPRSDTAGGRPTVTFTGEMFPADPISSSRLRGSMQTGWESKAEAMAANSRTGSSPKPTVSSPPYLKPASVT